MYYVGVDLHKKTISICVVIQEGAKRRIVKRQTLACSSVDAIEQFFAGLGSYQVVVEATASYEWFMQLVESTADRVVLAHPGKLRVISPKAPARPTSWTPKCWLSSWRWI